MRNLLLSFGGALVLHLFFLLAPLAGPRPPANLEQPRPGGGVVVHFRDDLRLQNEKKGPPSVPLVAEPGGLQAGPISKKRLTVAKITSPQTREIPTLIKAERQEASPVLQGQDDKARFTDLAQGKAQGADLKIDGEGEEVIAGPGSRVQALPLWEQNVKPHYPSLARRRGWQGTVLLEVLVLEDGTVGSLGVHTSSGHRLLDKTALAAVRKWVFMAAQKKGLAVPSRVLLPIHFTLAILGENT
jgi:protein TonB